MTSYRRDDYGDRRYPPKVTQFTAISDKPYTSYGGAGVTRENERAAANVNYYHPYESPNFESEPYMRDTNSGWTGKPSSELFSYSPGHVDSMFSDRSMKSHVPVLLGLVGALSHQLTGGKELPTPDSDLSRHSSTMVRKLRDKGVDLPLNEYNPESNQTNTIGHRDITALANAMPGRAVEPHEIKAGREMIRGLLRPAQPKETAPHERASVNALRGPHEQHPALASEQFHRARRPQQGQLFHLPDLTQRFQTRRS